ncbi:MAG: RluA family pseudouridine synthase [Pseudomonadota bacterium]
MQPTQSKKYKLTVDAKDSGSRLDCFLAEHIDVLSRSHAKRLIEEGHVLVNEKQVKPSHEILEGDRVRISIPPPVASSAVPEHIALDILCEDSDIIVVNKPVGMVVHPAAGHPSGTLVNALLAHCHDLSGIGGELKAGIVHRLDAGTSGVIIAAKNDLAHHSLANQFKARTVEKIYCALIIGSMRTETGTFDASLGRSSGDRKRISAHTRKGRAALTEWKVLEQFGKSLSWMEIKIKTGRTHQIRVHFAEAGHPLVGDPLYGGQRKLKRFPAGPLRDAASKLTRPALHASKLSIDHPRTGKRMEFTAPLPKDLEKLLNELRNV